MTKYRLMVEYQDGWYWRLYEFSAYGYYFRQVDTSQRLYDYRWSAILAGRLAAHKHKHKCKTPYTKEFTI